MHISRRFAGISLIVFAVAVMIITLTVTPVSTKAETTSSSGVQAQITQLLELVKTLQAQIAVLLGKNSVQGGASVVDGIRVGGHVLTSDSLKVRGEPRTSGALLAVVEASSHGTILEGPRMADGHTWWKVSYGKATGWSAANWLKVHTHPDESKVDAGENKDSQHTMPDKHSDHAVSDDNGDAPAGAIDIGESASQAARTLPNSTTVPTTAPFVQNFTGNTGKDDFRYGVFHAGVGFQELGYPARIWGDGNAQNGHGGHWTADHDMNCGTPATQRNLSSSASDFNIDEIFFLCKDHIMSSVGDVDGYSLAWFSPKKSFSRATHKKVSWDVNVTDLFGRQWWEVSIVPKGGHVVSTIEWNSRGDLIPYDNGSVIIGNGPFGGGVNMITNGENRYEDWRPICDGEYALDPVGCKDKMIRRPFSVTDNGNGTLTVNYAGLYTQTIPGKFPDQFDIYFTDHNYTPDKDDVPPGHTWHWDSIHVE